MAQGQESALQLIAGLGNPGARYERTRHNAGFWLVDALAREYAASMRADAYFQGDLGRISVGGRNLWLCKPMTFMNRCGSAIARLATFYKIPPSAILVVHDELDLPVGALRLKRSGGAGGHNGLRDIMANLGTGDFLRLRLGIGHPGNSREVVDYVLHAAPESEQCVIEQAINDAVREFPRLVDGELEKVMQSLHSRLVA
ncbi:MAG: aminoacyl-tRNA hydrolase [Gammaproteobacteria bacterium]|nr:aminoacyl-tRNA hydrolase [Gammaproteobacteria bacterium]MCP5424222.1 aminoacyl-tRNA hydrolase [Gammaproteobacteria bacterium]